MKHKTVCRLDELRIGDSFVYMKRTDPWRVIARADKSGRVAVNQVVNGKLQWNHDELKRGKTIVTFLRHTVPVPGEECFLEDLVAGDVFQRPEDDLLTEWVVVETGNDFWTVRKTTEAAPGKAGKFAKVIFLKHKS